MPGASKMETGLSYQAHTDCMPFLIIIMHVWYFVSLGRWVALLALILQPSLHPYLCQSLIVGRVYSPIPWLWMWPQVLHEPMACVPKFWWASSEPALKRPHMFLLVLLCLCHCIEKNVPQIACSSKEGRRLEQQTWTLSPTGSRTTTSAGPSLNLPTPADLWGQQSSPSQAQPRLANSHSACTLHKQW